MCLCMQSQGNRSLPTLIRSLCHGRQTAAACPTLSVSKIMRLQGGSTAAVGKGEQQRISFDIIVEEGSGEVGQVTGPLNVQCWTDQAWLVCCCCHCAVSDTNRFEKQLLL